MTAADTCYGLGVNQDGLDESLGQLTIYCGNTVGYIETDMAPSELDHFSGHQDSSDCNRSASMAYYLSIPLYGLTYDFSGTI